MDYRSFDNLVDLEVDKKEIKPKQSISIKDYPLAGMAYQAILKKAQKGKLRLAEVCKIIEKDCNISAIIPPLKGFERTIEKVQKNYSGSFRKVVDILRGTIVGHTMADLREAIALFSMHFEIYETKNRFTNPVASGYRDFKVIFYIKELDFFGEMQFNIHWILGLKEEEHNDYEIIRSILGSAKIEQRLLTKKEEKYIEELKEKSKVSYKKAWESYLRGEKASTEYLN